MRDTIVSKKQQTILDAYQSAPLKIGDVVVIDKINVKGKGGNSSKPNELVTYKILGINNDTVTVSVKEYGKMVLETVPMSVIVEKYDFHVGYNPMKESMPRVSFYSIDLWQLIVRAGYNENGTHRTDHNYFVDGVKINELNWNPWVIDVDGEKQHYQRDFVWSMKDRQLLIESIYNQVTIGTFIFRSHGYKYCEKLIKSGETDVAFKDIVDGKQRLNAIIEFVKGNFPDFAGNYFGDFSESAKRKFLNYSRLSFGELEEGTSDTDTIKVFLNTNFAGVPMSRDHIAFVQSLNV